MTRETFDLVPIGVIKSTLRRLEDAPMQGFEGAPDAWIEIEEAYADALKGLGVGQDVIIITWLHRAQRDVTSTYPRSDESQPLAGVFATRSPDRPNPLGLHRVGIMAIEGTRLQVAPIEAIDGTPVVDIKPVLLGAPDS